MSKAYEIVEMVGELNERTGKWSKEYAILFDGIQWGPIGSVRDPDGSADFTCSTKEEAIRIAEEANKGLM